jgi:hypothetical protein
MAIAFVLGTQADGASTTATSVSVSYTVAAGDFLLIGVAASCSALTSGLPPDISAASANLTLLERFNDGVSSSIAVFYRIVQAGDPASYTFNLTGGAPVIAMALRYTGVDTTTPFRNWNISGNMDDSQAPTSGTFPVLDNVQANDVVAALAAYGRNTKASTITAYTTPTNWTSRQTNTGPTSTTSFPVYGAWFERLGATDTPTVTGQAGRHSILSVALIPASNTVPDATGGTISFRNAATAATVATGATTLTVNKPSGVVDNDVMILIATQSRGYCVFSPPAGWKPIDLATVGVSRATSTDYNNLAAQVWYKIASGEAASYAVGCTNSGGAGTQEMALTIVAYSGVRNPNPVKLHSGSYTTTVVTTSSTPPAPALLEANADNLVVNIYTFGADGSGSITMTEPSGTWTQRSKVISNVASDFNTAIAVVDKLSASDQPTATSSAGASWAVFSLTLVGAPATAAFIWKPKLGPNYRR